MAFVHDQQRVLRQVFEQGGRRFARIAAGEVARVVLDSLAGAGGLHHLDVEDGALFETLALEQLALGLQLREPFLQLDLDLRDRLRERGPRRDVVAVGVDRDAFHLGRDLAGQRVEFADAVDLVPEQGDAPGAVIEVGWPDVHALAAHAEGAAREEGVVAAVLLFHEALHQRVAVDPPAAFELHDHAAVGLDRPDAVDAGDGGDDHHVVAFEQRLRGGMPHAVDLLVDLGILLDIGVGARHIGFRLEVVVVADEVFHRVVGEEGLHLAIELGRERLVGGEHQRGALQFLDHLGHGEGLARAGDAQQHLVAFALQQPARQFTDGGGLVAIGLEGGDDLEPPFGRRRRALLRHEHHGAGGDQVHRAKMAPGRRRRHLRLRRKAMPGEGFEPPAFGLQNRCTTTVLTRRAALV